jgi:cold shock CspA family protein
MPDSRSQDGFEKPSPQVQVSRPEASEPPSLSTLSSPDLVRTSIKFFRQNRVLMGALGIAAAGAGILQQYAGDWRLALWVMLAVLVFMVLLTVFASLPKETLQKPSKVMVWTCIGAFEFYVGFGTFVFVREAPWSNKNVTVAGPLHPPAPVLPPTVQPPEPNKSATSSTGEPSKGAVTSHHKNTIHKAVALVPASTSVSPEPSSEDQFPADQEKPGLRFVADDTGRVLSLNSKEGYAMIKSDLRSVKDDVHVNLAAVVGGAQGFRSGQRVKYRLYRGPLGFQAEQVEITEPAQGFTAPQSLSSN